MATLTWSWLEGMAAEMQTKLRELRGGGCRQPSSHNQALFEN